MMKKAMKHFAAFALCLCILANFLPVQAAAAPTRPCTSCGKTAYYSGANGDTELFGKSSNINGFWAFGQHFFLLLTS